MRKTQRRRRLKEKRRKAQLTILRRFHPEAVRVVMWVDELAEWPSGRWASVLHSFVGVGKVAKR